MVSHCSARGVCSLWCAACLTTTEKTDFSSCRYVEVSLLRGWVFTAFSSLLVGVRLRKSISPVAVERRSVSFAAGVFTALVACLLMYDLRKSIFPVAVEWRSISSTAGYSPFL